MWIAYDKISREASLDADTRAEGGLGRQFSSGNRWLSEEPDCERVFMDAPGVSLEDTGNG